MSVKPKKDVVKAVVAKAVEAMGTAEAEEVDEDVAEADDAAADSPPAKAKPKRKFAPGSRYVSQQVSAINAFLGGFNVVFLSSFVLLRMLPQSKLFSVFCLAVCSTHTHSHSRRVHLR